MTKKKTSHLARLGLLCGIAPFIISCVVMACLFGFDESDSPTTFQNAVQALAILGWPIAAIVLGFLALRQIKQNPILGGKGVAYAALIVGGLWLVLFATAALVGSHNEQGIQGKNGTHFTASTQAATTR